MHEIIFDVETQKDFAQVGGRKNHHLLGVSIVVVYSSQDEQFHAFEESQMKELEDLFISAEKIIGFNIKGFDLLVLKPYFTRVILEQKQILDLMEEPMQYLGYRPSLESLAQATLNQGKSGSGMEALKLFREGKMDELKKYCQDDVRITKELYEYGRANGKVLVKSFDGVQSHGVPVHW